MSAATLGFSAMITAGMFPGGKPAILEVSF